MPGLIDFEKLTWCDVVKRYDLDPLERQDLLKKLYAYRSGSVIHLEPGGYLSVRPASGWRIEDAASPATARTYAAVADVGHDQVLIWTQDEGEALRFETLDEARAFVREHVTRVVRIFCQLADEVDRWPDGVRVTGPELRSR